LYGGLQPCLHPNSLKRRLQGEAIDYGRQHAHVVCLHAIHSVVGTLNTPKNIASSDDNTKLCTAADYGLNFFSVSANDFGVNSIGLIAHQGFAAEFKENSAVFHLNAKIIQRPPEGGLQ
jgi:hypothetical protein